jgi:isopentenyldiphosphate isomerase
MKIEMLEVVDENGQVIGLETRKRVHQEGLLHREIHVWFMTPNKEIIFQHRAKDKDTYPDKLDATIGGHVDPGMSYDETAIKECLEETGLRLRVNQLKFVRKMRGESHDHTTGLINNTIRAEYVYWYESGVDDLKVEEGKAVGFEAWKIDDLSTLSEEDKQKFIPLVITKEFVDLFEEGYQLSQGC